MDCLKEPSSIASCPLDRGIIDRSLQLSCLCLSSLLSEECKRKQSRPHIYACSLLALKLAVCDSP